MKSENKRKPTKKQLRLVRPGDLPPPIPSKAATVCLPEDGELDRINLLKDQFDRIRRGGEFDKTQLLELFEFDVDEQGKSKIVHMLGMVRRFRDVRYAPGGLSFLRLQLQVSKGKIKTKDKQHISSIVGGLMAIVFRAAEGDERAALQLEAIERVVWPEMHDLQFTDLQKLASFSTNPSLARAWELKKIMMAVSRVVQTKDGGELEPISCIVPKEQPSATDIRWCGKGVWEQVQNRGNWKANSTLQSLAMRIFQTLLNDNQVTKRTLIGDLRVAEDWERSHPNDAKTTEGHLEYRPFSDGWKEKRTKQRKSK